MSIKEQIQIRANRSNSKGHNIPYKQDKNNKKINSDKSLIKVIKDKLQKTLIEEDNYNKSEQILKLQRKEENELPKNEIFNCLFFLFLFCLKIMISFIVHDKKL